MACEYILQIVTPRTDRGRGDISAGNTRGKDKCVQGKGLSADSLRAYYPRISNVCSLFKDKHLHSLRKLELATDYVNKQIRKKFPLEPGYI